MGTLTTVPTFQPTTLRVDSASRTRGASRLRGGGTAGNERLTALAGAILLAPLAVIGVTLLDLRGLMDVHLFVGILLIGPVLLKIAATGYRFARYYLGDRAYRLRGAPPLAMRALGPFVLISTLVVFASGVALLAVGPGNQGALGSLHKISFIVWAVVTGVHILVHLPAVGRAIGAEVSPALRGKIPGRDGRLLSLLGAFGAALVVSVLLVPDFAQWVHWSAQHHHHH
jgi:hypothetical protein